MVIESIEELSSIPSKAIRQAIADLEACEKDGRYKIDMNEWHTPMRYADGERICSVCLAGAVMTRYKISDETATPSDFDTNIRRRLRALNHFRKGDLLAGLHYFDLVQYANAMRCLYSNPKNITPTFEVTPYQFNASAFKHQMLAMADYLEEHGY